MGARGVGLAAGALLLALPGCTPITTRNARAREAGWSPPAAGPESTSVTDLGRDASQFPEGQRRVVQAALGLVGAPRSDLDCSDFVRRVYAAAGVDLPRTVRELQTVGEPVGERRLEPGDLVFFAFGRRGVDHVGVYAGRGQVVHVSTAARRVQIASLATPALAAARAGARRAIPARGVATRPGV